MESTLIAIPTYYGGQMVLNCVQSVLKNVVAPQIFVNQNDVGWLKACNDIMRNTNHDIILLNDDTLVLTDIAKEMRELAYSDPKIAIVGGMSVAHDSDKIINYGIYVAPDGNTAHKYYGQPKDSVGVEKQQAVEGSCMYIKRGAMVELGFFEEKYGMGYRAEVDYCFRARKRGYKVMSTPKAQYVHLTSQTASRLGITNDTHETFMQDWGKDLQLGNV